ncbi:MAG: ABC transporter ATP-binding protein [Candidatus Bathyarchaeia archaeon]
MNSASQSIKPLLSIRGLTVEFKLSRGILRAVDNVDLDIYEGEVFALVGESGCGKSVLAHALIKQVDPNGYITGGNVFFEGKDVLSLSEEELRRFRWTKIAIIFQGALNSLNPVMRVGEHFIDTIQAHEEVLLEDVHNRPMKLLKMVRLDADRIIRLYPHEISGGMKQRIIAALALLLKPRLLILDEPTSSLDVLTQRYFLDVIKDLHEREKITMLYITHDIATVADIADRMAVMYLGNIVEIGNVDSIFYEPKHPYTYALLNAIPSITSNISNLKPLPGPFPDPINPPSGCKFHPRCPQTFDLCKKERPRLMHIGQGRFVACHLYKDLCKEENK